MYMFNRILSQHSICPTFAFQPPTPQIHRFPSKKNPHRTSFFDQGVLKLKLGSKLTSKMLIFSLLTLLPVLVVCSSLSPAQLYLSPATISSSRSSESIELDSQQVNAVLAHHLGVAAYERFPVRHGSKQRDWEEALTTGGWSEAEKLVIVLECDEGGCQGKQIHYGCECRLASCILMIYGRV